MITRKVKSVRALERGLDVLNEIQQRRAASLNELHLALGLPKATLLRMLVTLSSRGLIWQRLADGAYLASMIRDARVPRGDVSTRLAEIASAELAALSSRVAWPSVLAVPRLDHVEIVVGELAPLFLHLAFQLGPVALHDVVVHRTNSSLVQRTRRAPCTTFAV